jgi:hypothetical protein
MPYRHTQRGTFTLIVCLLFAAIDALIAWRSGQWSPVVVLIVTLEVGDNELRWHFGPGLWTYRLPLDEIKEVAVVKNHWWNGFGIRMGPGFRLYNVSGLDAVELRLKSDEVRRIGTDDPQGLANVLQSQAPRR